MRLGAAGAAADSTYGEIVQRRFASRLETEVAADLADLLREFGHEQVDFTVVGSGPFRCAMSSPRPTLMQS
jgi:Xaa-Pro aminopeptidase